MKIYIINGIGGSGKDTFIRLCEEFIEEIGCVSAVDYVKLLLSEVGVYDKEDFTHLGWKKEPPKTPKLRKLLSDIKIALQEYDDMTIKFMEEMIKSASSYPYKLFFIISREKPDIERLKELYPKAKTILIRRNQGMMERLCETESKFLPNVVDYDIIIENSGSLDALEEEVKTFLINENLINQDIS